MYTDNESYSLIPGADRLVRDIPFKEAMRDFLEHKRASRMSENTLVVYQVAFDKFTAYMKADDFRVDMVDVYDIERFLISLEGLSNATVKRYHTALSSFWTWAVKRGYAASHVVRMVKPPQPEVRQVKPFERVEIRAMLEAVRRTRTPRRNKALLLFLLDTGVRASELGNAKVGDIEGNFVSVLGKGNKRRTVPISAVTRKALTDYFIRSQAHHSPNAPIFPSLTTKRHMKKDGVRRVVKRIGALAAVPNAHPHRFRHTFAITYLRNGGDIYTLQAILGHHSLEMVKRYLAIARVDIQTAHEKASPVLHWVYRPEAGPSSAEWEE